MPFNEQSPCTATMGTLPGAALSRRIHRSSIFLRSPPKAFDSLKLLATSRKRQLRQRRAHGRNVLSEKNAEHQFAPVLFSCNNPGSVLSRTTMAWSAYQTFA